MSDALPNYPNFDSNSSGDVAIRWTKWVSRFKNLMLACNITDQMRQRALLLHYAGEQPHDIFDTLPDTVATENENTLDKAVNALTAHFALKRNREYEVYTFRQAKQNMDEDMTTYYTRLRQLSSTCVFTDVDREIQSQIIQNCSSSRHRRKALSDPEMTLSRLIDVARVMELSEIQAKGIEHVSNISHSQCVNKVTKHGRPKQWAPTVKETQSNSIKCRNCGQSWPHNGGKSACPAMGRECRNCTKLNHFASCCRSKPTTTIRRKPQQKRGVHVVDADSSSDDAHVYKLTMCDVTVGVNKIDERPHFVVSVNGHQVDIIADSGAEINIIDEKHYNEMKPQPKLRHDNTKILPYGSTTSLPVKGVFNATVKSATQQSDEIFYVVAGSGGSLLGWKTSKRLNLVCVVEQLSTNIQCSTAVDHLVSEYDDLFQGLGKLRNFNVKLHIDDTVKPIAQPHRRIPFHVRKQLEQELKRDEELGVIERIEGATPWVSPLVVVPKPKSEGQIRVCVDMRQANEAIVRERHITPTITELVNDLNGATLLSKLDLNQGYNQLELEQSSRYITTFSPHLGLWRYKRLNFGVSSAAEVFQNAIRETLSGISGAINISDDILVFGATQEEHDKNLKATFERLRECGLTLNRNKCAYNKGTLEFFGYVFSKGGLSADPKKISAIQNLETPSNATQVRSLLGMSNFRARFIPGYATMTQPLRELMKKDAPWTWTEECSKSLASIRQSLSNAPVLAYFNEQKATQIYVDASPLGLGAILSQHDNNGENECVIAYGSRALTAVEQRYSQTEREALAVVWACEHFHLYVYGQPVKIFTDHKALVSIYGNRKSKPPTRIERWAIRLQPYNATVIYRPGSDNPADFLSRHPHKDANRASREEKVAEEFVNYVTINSVPKAMAIEHVRRETLVDPTLQAVMQALRTGKWQQNLSNEVHVDSYKSYQQLQDELTASVDGDTILRGHRLIIPAALQTKAVDLAHEGHQGIVKTKALLREKIWFPGIDKMVERRVKSCIPCQASVPETKREPLKMSPLPTAPWTEISVDFAELPMGQYLLVLMDDYSRFPIVEIVPSTSASVVIPRLDKVLSEYGTPDVLRTDNGPPFNSRDFANFAEDLGFRHRKITPYWPRANAEVETFMRTVKKVIKTSICEQRDWKAELNRFLRNYRATPHGTTGFPPATLLHDRWMKIKLPQLMTEPSNRRDLQKRDSDNKAKMKKAADSKSYVKQSTLKEGDVVLVKPAIRRRKTDPAYGEQPYRVIQIKGSMVTAERGNHKVTRNTSFFKRVNNDVYFDAEDSWDDDDDVGENPPVAPVQPVADAPRYPARQRRRPRRFDDYAV